MVGSRRSEEVADPSMELKPTSRALKRSLLVALRCVDPDALKRPKIGHVVHMLEAEDFPFRDVHILSLSLSAAAQARLISNVSICFVQKFVALIILLCPFLPFLRVYINKTLAKIHILISLKTLDFCF
jgi:hypothetical protein